MDNNIFAIFDSCSGIFSDPFIAVNDVVAKRIFEFSLSNPSIPKFVRDDAVLYALGHFDCRTGSFSMDVPPYVVARGSTVAPDLTGVNSVKEDDPIEE